MDGLDAIWLMRVDVAFVCVDRVVERLLTDWEARFRELFIVLNGDFHFDDLGDWGWEE